MYVFMYIHDDTWLHICIQKNDYIVSGVGVGHMWFSGSQVSDGTHVNESCRKWVTAHIRMCHVTGESWHTWITAHMRMSHVTHESWHTCEWVMSQVESVGGAGVGAAIAQFSKERAGEAKALVQVKCVHASTHTHTHTRTHKRMLSVLISSQSKLFSIKVDATALVQMICTAFARTHAQSHTHTNTRRHTHMYTRSFCCSVFQEIYTYCIYMHTCINLFMYVYIFIYIYIYIYTYICIYTDIYV